ncbi:cell wall metabolism sensor histidine kinase WalK [Pseudoroseomonas cervicalis]|uniref:sensor histidine kinase n=1 Tax=Teichococcus cervicalis TaxID=204525 RepID=UPI0027891F40|nr:ATP-binding protein [Pseudoroseomonas cervicalis]MDQ1080643.1 two-component system OmpR family sensor kinase [Pseudoroseomonas cervicalis]
MKRPALPLVFRTAFILIGCVLLVQGLNMALFLVCPPVPLGPVGFGTVQQALIEGRYGRGLEIREVPAAEIAPQEPRLAPLRDLVAARLKLPPEAVRLGLAELPEFKLVPNYTGVDSLAPAGSLDAARLDFTGGFRLARQLENGHWRSVTPSSALIRGWITLAFGWVLGTIIFAIPCAYLVAHWLGRPIRQFAEAAERLGRNPREPDLKPDGPRELHGAVLAFNEMKQRLGRYVDDRLGMMSAIAHDLRIPLTRLAFRLERAPEAIRAKAEADIAEMQRMLGAVLAFVQTTHAQRPRQQQELRSLLCTIADNMVETGRDVRLEDGPDIILEADDIGLRSLFTNLIHNAVTYGGTARVRLAQEGGAAVIEIEDDGPGLPPEELERVFEPFYRGEKSRNRATGGIGLGLALVRSVAIAHGGSATLENLASRGLRARIVLPA